jgi:hypothetical protein
MEDPMKLSRYYKQVILLAVTAGALVAGSVSANAQLLGPNLNMIRFMVGGTSTVTTDWYLGLDGIKLVSLYDGTNTGSFDALPLSFSESGTLGMDLSATMDMPLIDNSTDPYGQATPHANPLTFSETTYGLLSGNFSMKAAIPTTYYNEVGTAAIGLEDVYQEYTTGDVTISGTAKKSGNTYTLSNLSLFVSVISGLNLDTIDAAPPLLGGATDPTATGAVTDTSGTVVTYDGLNLTQSVTNTVTWTLSPGTGFVVPAPPAMALCLPGFLGMALRLKRRR